MDLAPPAPWKSRTKLVALVLVAACSRSSSPPPVDNQAPAEARPCPSTPPGRIREGTAVINASPDDLPDLPGERARLRVDQVHGVPRPEAGFALWRDGARWHLRASGPRGTQLQARVELVRDVVAEAPVDGLRVIHAPWQEPAKCYGDPPTFDSARLRAGFDLTADDAAHGIAFAANGCFVVDVRRAGARASLTIGDGGGGGGATGSVEICP